VGVAEAHDGRVAVLVTGAVVIDARLVAAVDIVGDGVRVGTHLHAPERIACAGEGVPHAIGPDHRVDILGIIALRGSGNHGKEDYGGEYLSHFWRILGGKGTIYYLKKYEF